MVKYIFFLSLDVVKFLVYTLTLTLIETKQVLYFNYLLGSMINNIVIFKSKYIF